MDFDLQYLESGIQAGQNQCIGLITGFKTTEYSMQHIRSVIAEVLKQEPQEWHPRAISLFSEVVTIGGLSRAHYGEKELEVNEVTEFLGWIGKIFNSFVHK
jgi:hypothetical protein